MCRYNVCMSISITEARGQCWVLVLTFLIVWDGLCFVDHHCVLQSSSHGAPEDSLFLPPVSLGSTEMTDVSFCIWLYLCSEDLNPGPHGCAANPILMEPSSQPSWDFSEFIHSLKFLELTCVKDKNAFEILFIFLQKKSLHSPVFQDCWYFQLPFSRWDFLSLVKPPESLMQYRYRAPITV